MYDHIVDEVYSRREKILKECNGDLAKWIERLRKAEARHRSRLVTIDMVREKRRLSKEAG